MFAGIDYLTLWSDSSVAANTSFYEMGTNWLAEITPASHKLKTATLHGTRGIRSEGIYIGIGDTRALLNVPGALAQRAYCDLYNTSHKVTRMDVQVTSTHGYDVKQPEAPFWRWEEQLRLAKPQGKGRKVKPTFVGGVGEGITIYSGSNDSDTRGRIYDKWKQSGEMEYLNTVRWEVVVRRKLAEIIATRFAMLTFDEITSAIPELVASFWQKRGLYCPWGMSHSKLWRTAPVKPWDFERSLKWLEHSVAPTIEKLRGYVPLAQILEALGLAYDPIQEYPISSGDSSSLPLNMEEET